MKNHLFNMWFICRCAPIHSLSCGIGGPKIHVSGVGEKVVFHVVVRSSRSPFLVLCLPVGWFQEGWFVVYWVVTCFSSYFELMDIEFVILQ